MELLNLNTLASSLPNAHQNAEKELLNNFKAAALSITTLYRSSRENSKRAYNAGYAAACQDLLTMIQQGVSLDPSGSSHDAEGGGMTIGRVMDWTEARLEAIKSREEEEDEDEREKERGRPPASSVATKPDEAASIPNTQRKEQPVSLPTPNSPHSQASTQLPYEPSSPSPTTSAALRPTQRSFKPRPPSKGELTAPYMTPATPDFSADGVTIFPPSAPLSDISIPIAAGAKRRHAMMMMLDSGSSPSSSSSTGGGSGTSGANHGSSTLTSRRRTKSSKNLTLQQSQNQNFNLIQATTEAMDVEEDGGRERKRVARR